MTYKNYTRVEITNINSCYYGEKGYVSKSIDIMGIPHYLICFDSGEKTYFSENEFVEI